MTRVIVHSGFHKTGTTSLQDYLASHRAAFAPWFAYYGPGDFEDAGARARIYAQHPFSWRLASFRRGFRQFLAAVPEATTIVMSRENFSGNMPGHLDWRGRMLTDFRSAAVPLGLVIRDELVRRFGADAEIEFLYTTRARDAWIGSVYRHLLRSIRLTDTPEAFAARLSSFPALEDEARAIAGAVGVTATIHPLEALADRRPGPAFAVLERTGVPPGVWAALPPARRTNIGQTERIAARFLELNRSATSKKDLKRLKAALIAEAGGAG